MKDLYIITYDTGLVGRKSLYIAGYDNAIAMYEDAKKEGEKPRLFESKVGEYGIVTFGRQIR